jgi:hypothetical protein
VSDSDLEEELLRLRNGERIGENNVQEARAALALIRQSVEEVAPVGAVPNGECWTRHSIRRLRCACSRAICHCRSVNSVMISIPPPCTDLKLRLMHSFKVNSLRHRKPWRKAVSAGCLPPPPPGLRSLWAISLTLTSSFALTQALTRSRNSDWWHRWSICCGWFGSRRQCDLVARSRLPGVTKSMGCDPTRVAAPAAAKYLVPDQ